MLKKYSIAVLLLIFTLCAAFGAIAAQNAAPAQAQNGREAYAAYLGEKLSFIAAARAELEAFGYKGKSDWGVEIPDEEQLEFMWATRGSESLQKKIRKIVSNSKLGAAERDQKFDILIKIVADLTRSSPLRSIEQNFLGSSAMRSGNNESDEAFAALLKYEQARAETFVFMVKLVDSLGYSLDDRRISLPLDEEAVQFLWQAKPGAAEMKNLALLVKEDPRRNYSKNDVAAMLKGADAYRLSKQLERYINTFYYNIGRAGESFVPMQVTPELAAVLTAPGLARYQPVKGYTKPAAFLPMQGKLPSGISARRLDLLSMHNAKSLSLILGSESAYALLHRDRYFSSYSSSYGGEEDGAAKTQQHILAGTPLEAFTEVTFRLVNWASMDKGDQEDLLANQLERDTSMGFVAVSEAPLEELAAHLGWLHILHFEEEEGVANAEEGVANAEEGGQNADAASILYYMNEPGPSFAWLAAYADADSLDALFGPIKRVYIYWPGEDRTKPWVELSREGASTPVRRLGSDALLHFGLDEQRDVAAPLNTQIMRPRIVRRLMETLEHQGVQREYPGIAQFSAAQLYEVAEKAANLHEELDAPLRVRLPARDILAGWILLGMNDEAFTSMRKVLFEQGTPANEKSRKFYDWLEAVYEEHRKKAE